MKFKIYDDHPVVFERDCTATRNGVTHLTSDMAQSSSCQNVKYYSMNKQPSDYLSFVLEVGVLPIDELCEELKTFGQIEMEDVGLDFKSSAKTAQNHSLDMSIKEVEKVEASVSGDSNRLYSGYTYQQYVNQYRKDPPGVSKVHQFKINFEINLKDPSITGEKFALLAGDLELCSNDRRISLHPYSVPTPGKQQSEKLIVVSLDIPKTSWLKEITKLRLAVNAKVDYQGKCEGEQGRDGPQGMKMVSDIKTETEGEPSVQTKFYEELYLSDKLSDIVIQCGEEKLHAHRFVLAMASPVFMTMLTSDLAGAEQKENTITVKDTSAEVWKELLRFIYTGKVDTQKWTMKLSQDVYNVAKMYDFPPLQKICEYNFKSMISVDTALGLYEWAQIHELNDVLEKVTDCIVDNKAAILKDNIQEIANCFPDLMRKLAGV